MENMETHQENGYNINDYIHRSDNNNDKIRITPLTPEKIPIIFDHLLQVGTIKDINNFFATYAISTSLEFVRYMVNNGADPSHCESIVFRQACYRHDYKRIVYFVNECNIDINVYGSYALVNVMRNINNIPGREINSGIDCLKFLLDSGCIITDACIEECVEYDRGIEPMRLLIQHGVEIDRIGIIFCKSHLSSGIFGNIIHLNNFDFDFKQALDKCIKDGIN